MALHFDFGKLDPGGEPVYLQIIRRFKLLILQEKLLDGDEVPSRRMLAASLGVNPNTVQKALSELEKEGLIETPANAKSLVCINDEAKVRLRTELLEKHIADLIVMSKGARLSYKQLIDLISTGWDEN